MIKGAVFDMDGLMFDTENLTFKIWNEILTEKDYSYSFDIYKKTIGVRSAEVKDFYGNLYGNSFDYDKIKAEAMERFWEYTEKYGVPIKTGLFEILDYLKSKDIKIALATSTTTKSATEILTRAKVIDYFDRLICGDMVKNSKPDPEIFITAVKELGEKPQDCIALEDSINGIKSAYNAGLKCIMVPDLMEPTNEIRPMLFALCQDLIQVKNTYKLKMESC
ncbi:MAG: HAD family hydrolase [Ruminococcus sp.]